MVTERLSFTEKVLGSVGLMLIGLIGWASERPHRRALSEVLVRVVVGFVAVVGWVVDRLPLPNPPSPGAPMAGAILEARYPDTVNHEWHAVVERSTITVSSR